jgi:type 1 glutamine amidotransferase
MQQLSRKYARSIWHRVHPGLALLALVVSSSLPGANLTFRGTTGAGHGKHIVLIAGDDEYHSEEMLPQLAKILATRQGFTSTVLFSVNPETGTIDPHEQHNIPGLESLRDADLLILLTRFRDLPDEQMKYVVDYVESGRPIIGIRTATHAFALKTSHTYERYSWDSKVPGWEGGFGRRILGETWIAHHGHHGKQSTRGIFVEGEANNPILRGINSKQIWVPTDVYEVRLPQPPACRPLILGEVLSGMQPGDQPVSGEQNNPMRPVAWTTSYAGASGKKSRVFVTTMGDADDLENESFRRLLVNATYWAVQMEEDIPPKANVDLVGDYHPRTFLDESYTKGIRPQDLAK